MTRRTFQWRVLVELKHVKKEVRHLRFGPGANRNQCLSNLMYSRSWKAQISPQIRKTTKYVLVFHSYFKTLQVTAKPSPQKRFSSLQFSARPWPSASLRFISALKSLLGFPPDSMQLLCSVTEVRLVASPQTMTSPRNPPFGNNSADRYLTAALHQLFKCFSAARRSEEGLPVTQLLFLRGFTFYGWPRHEEVTLKAAFKVWKCDFTEPGWRTKRHPEDVFCVISCKNRFLSALNFKINQLFYDHFHFSQKKM